MRGRRHRAKTSPPAEYSWGYVCRSKVGRGYITAENSLGTLASSRWRTTLSRSSSEWTPARTVRGDHTARDGAGQPPILLTGGEWSSRLFVFFSAPPSSGYTIEWPPQTSVDWGELRERESAHTVDRGVIALLSPAHTIEC